MIFEINVFDTRPFLFHIRTQKRNKVTTLTPTDPRGVDPSQARFSREIDNSEKFNSKYDLNFVPKHYIVFLQFAAGRRDVGATR